MDVYYSSSGLRGSTILHESLHIFYGSTYDNDRDLAHQLGVSDADYDAQGSEAIDNALAAGGCG